MLNAIGTGTVCWIGVERFDDDDEEDVPGPFADDSLKNKIIHIN
jgi:hypothetical protein